MMDVEGRGFGFAKRGPSDGDGRTESKDGRKGGKTGAGGDAFTVGEVSTEVVSN
jgi:hypothetical protein